MNLKWTERVNASRHYMVNLLGSTYEACKKKDEYDWKLFTNCYDMATDYLNEIEKIEEPSSTLWLVLLEGFENQITELERQREYLIERDML